MTTEQEIYAKFSPRDKLWPVCICGHLAQDHPHVGSDKCWCRDYRPSLPLTANQKELEDFRRQQESKESIKMSPELEQIIKKFMRYSFRDIRFMWMNLTDNEKSFCTEQEFQQLCEWIHAE